jgi:hypothetical protein
MIHSTRTSIVKRTHTAAGIHLIQTEPQLQHLDDSMKGLDVEKNTRDAGTRRHHDLAQRSHELPPFHEFVDGPFSGLEIRTPHTRTLARRGWCFVDISIVGLYSLVLKGILDGLAGIYPLGFAVISSTRIIMQRMRLGIFIVLVTLFSLGSSKPTVAQNSCLCLPPTNQGDGLLNPSEILFDSCDAGLPSGLTCLEAYKAYAHKSNFDSIRSRWYSAGKWAIRLTGNVLFDSIVVCSWEHPRLPPVEISSSSIDSSRSLSVRNALRTLEGIVVGGMSLTATFYDSHYRTLDLELVFGIPQNIVGIESIGRQMDSVVFFSFTGSFIQYNTSEVKLRDRHFAPTLSTYPNPARDEVLLRYSTSQRTGLVSIFSSIGQLVASYEVPEGHGALQTIRCTVSDLPCGLYTVRTGDQVGSFAIVR